MNTWRESEMVFESALAALERGERPALATVVDISGSTYRRPGARLLIAGGRILAGNVSGGCLEQDVCEVAARVLQSGAPEIVHYNTGQDEDILWGMGLGCDGEIDILVQPLPGAGDERVAQVVKTLFRGDSPFALSTIMAGAGRGRMAVVAHDQLAAGGTSAADVDAAILAASIRLLEQGGTQIHQIGERRIFTEVLQTPPDLVIFGAGDDSIPLAACAADMGFRVTVVDHRPAYITASRFPSASRLVQARPEDGLAGIPAGRNAYAVVKTRGLLFDQGWSGQLAASTVAYIGLLGPRTRREKILQDIPAARRDVFYGPVGLDVGADGPQQVALSIVAEVMAVVAGRQPGHLRDRQKAIHA